MKKKPTLAHTKELLFLHCVVNQRSLVDRDAISRKRNKKEKMVEEEVVVVVGSAPALV